MTDTESLAVLAGTFMLGFCAGGLAVWFAAMRPVKQIDRAVQQALRP